MSLWRHLSRGVRVLTRRADADRDLDDELQHYLDEDVRARVAGGMSAEDAHRAARAHLQHGYVGTRERVRDGGWEHRITELLGDVRLALRMLARQPLLTCVVVLVIAVGSGAATTIYSAMNALVLRPVPGVTSQTRSSAFSRCGATVRYCSRHRSPATSPCETARQRSTGSPSGDAWP